MDNIKSRLSSRTFLILLVIIFLGAIFRFGNTPLRYGFDKDPTRDAVVTAYAINTAQIPLTGPPSGIAPFSFGPWYYYQLMAADILLPGVFAPWLYLGITSLLFVIVMFYLGREIKDDKLGLVMAFFAALSPAITGPSAGLSNPNFIPLYTALFIYLGVRYMNKRLNTYLIFVWGCVFGIALSHHYQVILLILLPLSACFFNRKNIIKNAILFISGVFVVSLPTIIFELQNNWHTVRGAIYYLQHGRNEIYIPNNWNIYVFDFWLPFFSYILGTPIVWGLLVIAFLITGNIIALYTRKISYIYVLLMTLLAIDVLFLRYFSSQREYYYFLFMLPSLIVFIGYSLSVFFDIPKLRYLPLCIIVITLPFILKQDFERIRTQPEIKEYQALSVSLKYRFPNDKFVFYECDERKINKVYAINYLLMNEGKLDEDGVKIGFASDKCMKVQSNEVLRFAALIPENKAYNLSKIDDNTLIKNGWRKITPNSIYDEVVKINQ